MGRGLVILPSQHVIKYYSEGSHPEVPEALVFVRSWFLSGVGVGDLFRKESLDSKSDKGGECRDCKNKEAITY